MTDDIEDKVNLAVLSATTSDYSEERESQWREAAEEAADRNLPAEFVEALNGVGDAYSRLRTVAEKMARQHVEPVKIPSAGARREYITRCKLARVSDQYGIPLDSLVQAGKLLYQLRTADDRHVPALIIGALIHGKILEP